MRLLSVLSGLMLSRCCLAGPQQGVNMEGQTSSGCGLTVRSVEGRIPDIPWMITVFASNSISCNGEVKTQKICDGSLIHYKAVLTLASCLNGYSAEQLEARARVETAEDEHPRFRQIKKVATIVTHPMHGPRSYLIDLAILVLRVAFTPSLNVLPVCLPEINQQFIGSECIAAEWDSTKLRHIKARVESENTCINSYPDYLHRYIDVEERQICTGLAMNGLNGECMGDGGGPLACPLPNNPSRFVQAGVVTKDTFCGKAVSLYWNVAFVRDWIDYTFRSNGIEHL